jgi:hypothetical protein
MPVRSIYSDSSVQIRDYGAMFIAYSRHVKNLTIMKFAFVFVMFFQFQIFFFAANLSLQERPFHEFLLYRENGVLLSWLFTVLLSSFDAAYQTAIPALKTASLMPLIRCSCIKSKRGYALDCTTHHILWLSIAINMLHVVVGTVKCIAPKANSFLSFAPLRPDCQAIVASLKYIYVTNIL